MKKVLVGPQGCLFSTVIVVLALASMSCSWGEKVSMTRYFVAYGIRDYQFVDDTNYGDVDAEDMRALLQNQGYTEEDYGIDSYATKSQIITMLESLTELESDATFLFYFSGHGIGIDSGSGEEEYFAPYDSAYGTSGYIDTSTLISTKEFSDALAKIPCKNKIVVLDTCYSGGFVDTGSAIDTAPQNYGTLDDGTEGSTVITAFSSFGDLLVANAEENNATAPIVLSAAGADEYSYENGDYENGLFTYFFIASAAKGDSNGDGYVTAIEAYAYAKEKINDVWNSEEWDNAYYYYESGEYADFMPRISGGARDLVLFSTD